jgi:hypothetical protein
MAARVRPVRAARSPDRSRAINRGLRVCVWCATLGRTLATTSVKILFAVLLSVLATRSLHAQAVALFNGRDLTGWHVDVPAMDSTPTRTSPFVVRNGVLAIAGEPRGHLITDARYQDYRLEVEYRFPAAPGNAGVLIHASRPRALYSMFPQSIEVQMESGNAGDFWCIVEDIRVADMVRRRGPRAAWGITEGKARRIRHLRDGAERPVGEWNILVIEARGREVSVSVNAELVNRGTTARVSAGQIALQSEGAAVEVRRLVLTPLRPR